MTELVVNESPTRDTLNLIGRFVALVATAIPTIIGLIALAKFDWGGTGLDSVAVSVAGMWFRPWVAIATVVAGLFGLAAAASWDRQSKLFVGAIYVAAGVAILVANPTVESVLLNNRFGWMAIIVGAVLALVGLFTGRSWTAHRRPGGHDVGYV